MTKYVFCIQDVDQLGDPIYRDGESEKEALKDVSSQYPRVDFQVMAVYKLCEDC